MGAPILPEWFHQGYPRCLIGRERFTRLGSVNKLQRRFEI